MRIQIALSLLIATGAVCVGQSLPPDIDKESLSRFPAVKREQLDDKGKKIYDHVAGGAGKVLSPVGPAAVGMYSPNMYEHVRGLLDYFRTDTILPERLCELAILVAARESDQKYVWSSHEPSALKAGNAQAAVEAIKFGKDTTGLDPKDAALIRYGRELFREKAISSDTFAKTVEVFGKQGTVELTVLLGNYQLLAQVLKLADQHVPPDRKALLPPR